MISFFSNDTASHVARDFLRVHIFHGADRINEPNEYVNADVVITTYSTLVKDSKFARVLHRLNWFRVVLDEGENSRICSAFASSIHRRRLKLIRLAHWIHNQDTHQFQSVNALRACRRWCVTGTPIQNKLEDLGALVRFLKVVPFETKFSKAEFTRCIIDPLYSDLDDPCQNLRTLLQSVLLRRTSQSHSELTATYETVLLSLSTAERGQYTDILDKAKDDMDLLVNTTTGTQIYTRIFTMILRLRIFCNLGQFHDRVGSLLSQPRVASARSPVESDSGSELGCDICQREESRDLLKHRMFCPDCARLLKSNLPDPSDGSPAYSNITGRVSLSSRQVNNTGPLFEQRSQESNKLEAITEDVNRVYPTKLLAVVERLRQSDKESKRSV